VTKRILKEFAVRRGKVAVHDAVQGQRLLQLPGAGVFTARFDVYDYGYFGALQHLMIELLKVMLPDTTTSPVSQSPDPPPKQAEPKK
jgi:hypothetical protein